MISGYKKYRSKVGLGLLGILSLGFGVGLYYMIVDWNSIGALIHLVTFALVYYLFFSISYEIKGDDLLVNYAAFYQKKIKIPSICRIKETRNPLGSPAASLDRLEIQYGSNGFILVSPKEKMAFIDHLKSLNPEIQVEFRKKKE
ncbi:PH domain-containing protein [Flagellimonas nanhaiensis]|uniref:Uncharacterized protein YyaB-like PH domain-containing protein n=1 Tax=Flagellimonas nanhaiensis TaxID=2292706 RepID=A0A371JTB3_9FLAO|nr:PH domain-containing protein [Allomuricauda nanhaiensis]RDY61016.1 hypothetical protein DX873_02220 [Allomuricauda nanhaiensis]